MNHRGQQIHQRLEKRRALHRGRRYRKIRYRPACFANRCRPAGYLLPNILLFWTSFIVIPDEPPFSLSFRANAARLEISGNGAKR